MLYELNLDYKKPMRNPMPVFTLGDLCQLKISVFDDDEPVTEIERATIAIAGVATKLIDPETMLYTFGDEINKANYYKCTVQIYDSVGRSTTYEFAVKFKPDYSLAETESKHSPSVVEDMYQRIETLEARPFPEQGEKVDYDYLFENDKIKFELLPPIDCGSYKEEN